MLCGNIYLKKRKGWYLKIQSQAFYRALPRKQDQASPQMEFLKKWEMIDLIRCMSIVETIRTSAIKSRDDLDKRLYIANSPRLDGYLRSFCRHDEKFNPYGLSFILVVLWIVQSEFPGPSFSTVLQKHYRSFLGVGWGGGCTYYHKNK